MQQNLEATLASLVAIPSVPDDSFACRAIIDFVQAEVASYGLFVQTHDETQNPWFIATTQNTLTPDILFYAHLDVVPGPDHLFQMQKQNGHLIGRGVFDMKLATACYLEFLRSHIGSLSSLNIGFLFTTDEEKDSASMYDVIASGVRPKVAFIPDGGGNWAIEERAKGYHAVELVAKGKSAHGSRPWEGVSALHILLDAIKPLRERYALHEKDHPTLMVNGIQSGKAINQIPDHAVAQIDFRCFNAHEMNEYLALLEIMLSKNDSITLTVLNSGNTIEFDKTSPFVQGFLRTFQQIRGTSPTYCDSYGTSDARFFSALGIPCIIIEPGGGGRHASDEWLMADDLSEYYHLMEQWIMQEATASLPVYRQKVLVE